MQAITTGGCIVWLKTYSNIHVTPQIYTDIRDS